MPKSFTESERKIIQEELIKNAEECIMQYGMQKTTVDEIVKRSHIAKGSFYSFYESKELLFWDVMQNIHAKIDTQVQNGIESCEVVNVETLTDLIFGMYKKCLELKLSNTFINGDLDYLMRKLPKDVVKEHMMKDNDFFYNLVNQIPGMPSKKADIYAGAFRGIFIFLMYQQIIGLNFYEVLKLSVRGIVIQMFEELE